MKCPKCGANLTMSSSIKRKYVSDKNPDVFGKGHYEGTGNYEPDNNVDLSGGKYTFDDTCTNCDKVVG